MGLCIMSYRAFSEDLLQDSWGWRKLVWQEWRCSTSTFGALDLSQRQPLPLVVRVKTLSLGADGYWREHDDKLATGALDGAVLRQYSDGSVLNPSNAAQVEIAR